MPDQLKTNTSIISFAVELGGRALSHAELKELFRVVCTREHKGLSGELSRVFFGQPVAYGDQSFIRLAIGANSIRLFLERGGVQLADDERLIEIIEATAQELFGS